jgi:hypothetical protein
MRAQALIQTLHPGMEACNESPGSSTLRPWYLSSSEMHAHVMEGW